MSHAAAAEARLLALVEQGHALMERERALLIAGGFDAIEDIAAQKSELLASLDEVTRSLRGTPRLRRALDALIADSRRNERLLGAALGGMRSARRSIQAIVATRMGDVAYAADGTRITSRADAMRKTSRA